MWKSRIRKIIYNHNCILRLDQGCFHIKITNRNQYFSIFYEIISASRCSPRSRYMPRRRPINSVIERTLNKYRGKLSKEPRKSSLDRLSNQRSDYARNIEHVRRLVRARYQASITLRSFRLRPRHSEQRL